MIQSVTDTQGDALNTQNQQKAIQSTTGNSTFADFLKESMNQLNDLQNQSDNMTNALANGENVELYQVYVAAQKSSISMSAALEFRNKVVEAYQEIMRMSV